MAEYIQELSLARISNEIGQEGLWAKYVKFEFPAHDS